MFNCFSVPCDHMLRLLNISHKWIASHRFPGCRSYAVGTETATAVETSGMVSSEDAKVKMKLEGYSNKGQHKKNLASILFS